LKEAWREELLDCIRRVNRGETGIARGKQENKNARSPVEKPDHMVNSASAVAKA
jgi:hypothetical protein